MEQVLQREFGRFPVPPGTGTVSWLSLEICARRGPSARMRCKTCCVSGLWERNQAAWRRRRLPCGQAEAVIFHRQVGGSMRPVLENLPLFALGAVELRHLVRRQPRPEHMMVRPFNDRNGIDLDVAQASYDLWYRVRLQLGARERNAVVEPG